MAGTQSVGPPMCWAPSFQLGSEAELRGEEGRQCLGLAS